MKVKVKLVSYSFEEFVDLCKTYIAKLLTPECTVTCKYNESADDAVLKISFKHSTQLSCLVSLQSYYDFYETLVNSKDENQSHLALPYALTALYRDVYMFLE